MKSLLHSAREKECISAVMVEAQLMHNIWRQNFPADFTKIAAHCRQKRFIAIRHTLLLLEMIMALTLSTQGSLKALVKKAMSLLVFLRPATQPILLKRSKQRGKKE